MARAQYVDTALVVSSTGVVTAYPEVRVSVYLRGTTTLPPAQHAPQASASGNVPMSNPFITSNAKVEFWAEAGAYDIVIEDRLAPARFAPKTISWDAMPAVTAGFPSTFLAADAGLTLTRLADEIKRQLLPIGAVIDWWRPASTVPVPGGFEIADGRTVAAADHDFGTGVAIALPDLRGQFIIGADPAKADGAASTNNANALSSAPGIRGGGGTNAAKNFAHSHGVPGVDHLHYVPVPDHLHTTGGLYTGGHGHTYGGSIANRGHNNAWGGTAPESFAFVNHSHWGDVSGAGNIGVGGNTGASDRGLAVNTHGADRSLNTTTNSTAWTSDPGNSAQTVDLRPSHVGLLKIMKVRRS